MRGSDCVVRHVATDDIPMSGVAARTSSARAADQLKLVGAVSRAGVGVEVLLEAGPPRQPDHVVEQLRRQRVAARAPAVHARPSRWCSTRTARASTAAGRTRRRSGRSSARRGRRPRRRGRPARSASPAAASTTVSGSPGQHQGQQPTDGTFGQSPTGALIVGVEQATAGASATYSSSTNAAVIRSASAWCGPASAPIWPASSASAHSDQPHSALKPGSSTTNSPSLAHPAIVVAVIAIRPGQPDVAGVVLVGRAFVVTGVIEVAAGVGVEDGQVGRHRRQRGVPRRRVVHAGLPGMDDERQLTLAVRSGTAAGRRSGRPGTG